MVVLVLTCLMDMERGVLLYRSYPAGDYHKHILITDAIHRTGIHPVNPAFHPGRPLPLFFYFFWFLLCSMVDGLSGWCLGPRAAVEGMTPWADAGLFAVVLLLVYHFFRPVTRRTLAIQWALLFVTGLDAVGYLLYAFVNVQPQHMIWRGAPVFLGAVDSWNWDGQVTSWLESVLWGPHHFAAAIVVMTGLLLVFATPASRKARVFLFATAAASALGLSVWVALVAGGFWALWIVIALRRRFRQDLKILLQAALPAVLLALPLLYVLWHAQIGTRAPLVF